MNFVRYFEEGIADNKNFKDALKIIQDNVKGGNIWAIGGVVYKSIIEALYHSTDENIADFDFIVERPLPVGKIKLPSGWELSRTRHGEPRFKKGPIDVDFIYINHLKNLPQDLANSPGKIVEKFESYFKNVPLTVQAIVYDVRGNKIFGEIGMEAIKDKIIKVHNASECRSFCEHKKISVEEFIKQKMSALGFRGVFPKN